MLRYVKKMAMGDILEVLVNRFEKVVLDKGDDVFSASNEEGIKKAKKMSQLSSAMMKAVCYSRGWIEEVTLQKGE